MLDFNTNDWDFPVEAQPVYDPQGNEIEGYQAVTRTDTGRALAIHTDAYRIVPHGDVIDRVMDAARRADLSSDQKLVTYIADDGRKFRGEILFDDLRVEPDVGDYVRFRVSFFNSYDGSWSISANAEGERLWCLNGCTTPDKMTRSRHKHTANFSINAMMAKLQTGLQVFHESPDIWRGWMKTPVGMAEAERFFKKTICYQTNHTDDPNKSVNWRQFERLRTGFRSEASNLGANKWALYNCLTAWASHPDDSRNPQVTRRNREDQLARALSTRAWQEVAA